MNIYNIILLILLNGCFWGVIVPLQLLSKSPTTMDPTIEHCMPLMFFLTGGYFDTLHRVLKDAWDFDLHEFDTSHGNADFYVSEPLSRMEKILVMLSQVLLGNEFPAEKLESITLLLKFLSEQCGPHYNPLWIRNQMLRMYPYRDLSRPKSQYYGEDLKAVETRKIMIAEFPSFYNFTETQKNTQVCQHCLESSTECVCYNRCGCPVKDCTCTVCFNCKSLVRDYGYFLRFEGEELAIGEDLCDCGMEVRLTFDFWSDQTNLLPNLFV